MAEDTSTLAALFIDDTTLTFRRQKELAERAFAQVDDDDFFRTIDAESNSIAIITKHIGGNLRSRFTDFLKTDGEKPDRDRDGEFEVVAGTNRTLGTLRPTDLATTVHIRGEAVPALAALHRALAHIAQHVGQIVMLAKHLRSAEWKTLSIPRGQSGDWKTIPPQR